MNFKATGNALIVFFILLLQGNAWAQVTTVTGIVKEEKTGEPVMFAHVLFKGSGVGTATDTTGHFKIQINAERKKIDSLVVSCLGYQTKTVGVKPNVSQTLNITLQSDFIKLNEATVIFDKNPAFPILDRVIEHKKQNNPDNIGSFSCEEYSKIRFDLNHLTEGLKKNILFRPFGWIWDNADTTSDGVSYLPVLLIEKQVDHYYQSSPSQTRDVIKATNITGFKGPKIMQFANDLYAAPNLYDNFVTILEKSFPSPIHDHYKNHYFYYLEDSVMEQNEKVYIISFYPKYKRQLAFTGDMRIDAATHALRQVNVRFDIFTNINFVRSYWVGQRYEKTEGHWMPTDSQVIGDFTVAENVNELTGFFGRKSSTYKNYVINQPIDKKIFQGNELTVEEDSASLRNDAYWLTNRHAELTEKEKGVFTMTKKLEADPKFIFRKKLIVGIATGYVPVHQIDIGNFYTFYSWNVVEHSRVKFGFRSNKNNELPLRFSAYTAYGFYDEKWKYGGEASWNFTQKKKRPNRIGGSYKYDIEQLSRSFNNLALDNVLTSFVQYSGTSSRNYVTDWNLYAESSPALGWLARVNYFNNTIAQTDTLYFHETLTNAPIAHFNATGIDVTLKYSWQNNDMTGNFYSSEKKTYFRKYPDIAIQWKWADKYTFGSGLDFQKVNIQLHQVVRMNKLGYTRYYLEAGKTFGTVPYPYLNLPFANQVVFHDDYAFNLMNFLEYASDQFVTATVHHHFEGLLLDRIPLINKLKWRSFIFARAWWGSISDQNNAGVYQFAQNLSGLNKAYYEAGFGIENIFKIARMDFTWRLTDLDKPGIYPFIVKPSFKLSF